MMIYCCIADIKTWDLCAMMRHAGELPVRQGCGQAFQATQQIFPSSRMVSQFNLSYWNLMVL
jgi:hypothetical protein